MKFGENTSVHAVLRQLPIFIHTLFYCFFFFLIYLIYLTDPATYELMGDEVQNVKQEGEEEEEEEDKDTDKEKGLSDNSNSIYTNSRHRQHTAPKTARYNASGKLKATKTENTPEKINTGIKDGDPNHSSDNWGARILLETKHQPQL